MILIIFLQIGLKVMSKLELSKDMYKHIDLIKCCEDFRDYADIGIVDDNTHWTVEFRDCKLSEVETASEFENYLIELTYGSMDRC